MTRIQRSSLDPQPIFGVPEHTNPIHNLPAGSHATVVYSNDDFARATVEINGRVESWVLGTDDRGRTILGWKQSETMPCANCALLSAIATRLIAPVYTVLLPLLCVYRVLENDYIENRRMLDEYCAD